MSKITAQGKFRGTIIIVEVTLEGNEQIVRVNEEIDEDFQRYYDKLMESPPPMGGTYYPPEDSLLAVYNILENALFDEAPRIEVDGVLEEIPYEKGLIY